MARIRPAKFVHVVYRTRRFEAMLRWYATVFDARIQHQDPVLAFLTYDDEHHRFAFVNLSVIDPDGKEVDRSGAIGVARRRDAAAHRAPAGVAAPGRREPGLTALALGSTGNR